MTTTHTEADETLTDDQREAIFREAADARDANRTGITTQRLEAHPEAEPAAPAATPTPAPKPDPAPVTPTAAPAPQPSTTQPNAPAPAPAFKTVVKALEEMSVEELRQHSAALEHERRSALGREAAKNRELEQLKKQRTTAPAPAAVPEAERLSVAFPELATSVGHEVEARLAKEREEREQALTQERLATMEATFPGWSTTMQSGEFNYWLSQQPPDVQARIDSNSVADYASLLRGFQAASAPPSVTPQGQTEAERIAMQRAGRVATAAAIPRGRPSVGGNTSGMPDPETDPEGFFNALSKARDLKTSGARR